MYLYSIVTGESYKDYFSYVECEKPDYLLLEVATPSINNDLEILRKVKETNPNIKTIVAGIHTPISQESFLKENPEVDFAIYGEYEHPLLLLMSAVREGRVFSDVPNLVYRDESGEIKKNSREPLVSMDEIPWPDRDSLPDIYYDGCCGMPGKELQVHASRGCPYHCNFCAWPQFMYDHKYRMRDPKDFVDELLYYMEKGNYTHFYIDDDTVNVNKKHFIEMCRLIKETGLNKYQWGCMGRADLMDDEMLEAMKDAGCYSIKYGVENFNQEILNRTGKSMNIEKNIENIKKTRNLGIKVHLTYCLGLLGDTIETVKYTIDRSLELIADERQYSIATPYPGSKLWNEFKEKGMLKTEDFSEFDGNNNAVADQKDLPAKELIRLRDEAERRSLQQISRLLPASFEGNGFAESLVKLVGNESRILILGSAQRSIIKKIYNILADKNYYVNILTHERFLTEYDDIPKDNIINFLDPINFCKEEMQELIVDLNKKDYRLVIVPCRTFSKLGMENVCEVANAISDSMLMVYGNGKTERWDRKVISK